MRFSNLATKDLQHNFLIQSQGIFQKFLRNLYPYFNQLQTFLIFFFDLKTTTKLATTTIFDLFVKNCKFYSILLNSIDCRFCSHFYGRSFKVKGLRCCFCFLCPKLCQRPKQPTIQPTNQPTNPPQLTT